MKNDAGLPDFPSEKKSALPMQDVFLIFCVIEKNTGGGGGGGLKVFAPNCLGVFSFYFPLKLHHFL